MKKFLRTIMLGILCMGLITSCNSTENTNATNTTQKDNLTEVSAMGKYVEEDLPFIENLSNILIFKENEDKSLDLIITNKENKLEYYKSKMSSEWEKQSLTWIDNFNNSFVKPKELYVSSMAYGADGKIYITNNSFDGQKTYLYVVNGDNVEQKDIKWRLNEGKEPIIANISILGNGEILIANIYEAVERYSAEGEFIMEYTGSGNTLDVYNDKLIQFNEMEASVDVFNIQSGELEKSIAAVRDMREIWIDDKGIIYLAGPFGIQSTTLDGLEWKTIVDGNTTSFGMPSQNLINITNYNNEEFLGIFLNTLANFSLKRYVYSKDTPSVPTDEVVIYSLQNSRTIEQLKAEFQNKHPEIKLTVNVGMGQESSATKSDVIRALNTELLAGKGPDLILLDNLPIDSYVEKGVLLDLNGTINLGELNESITNTYNHENKIYAIPLTYQLPIMWGDNDIINSVKNLKDLADWGTNNKDKKLFNNVTPSELVEEFFTTSAPTFVKDKKIDKQELVNFLENIRTIESLDTSPENNEPMHNDGYVPRFRQKNDLIDFAYNDFSLCMSTIRSYSDLSGYVDAIKRRGNSSFALEADGVYTPTNIIGINANSKYQDISKEIIKLALSETVQGIDLYDGFPINTKSFEAGLEGKNSATAIDGYTTNEKGDRELHYIWPEAEYFKTLGNLATTFKTQSITDDVLLQIILEETTGYFNNEKTAELAADSIAQRAEAYFAE